MNPRRRLKSAQAEKIATAASQARSAGCPQLALYLEKLQLIPGGSFNRGSNTGKFDEKPVHRVTLTDYCLGRTLVPQELWAEYAQKGNGKMPPAPDWGWLPNHPIVKVSWDDTQGFCTWGSRVSGLKLVLPSEAQWEYAARGGGKDVKWPWGNTFLGLKLVFSGNSRERTAPVDRSDSAITNRVFVVRFSNGSELLDMAGNAYQWCSDWYGTYPRGAATNPAGPATGIYGLGKVLRGGSWNDDLEASFRCTARYFYPTSFSGNYHDWGFRLSLGKMPV